MSGMPDSSTKWCKRCSQSLAPTAFASNRSSPDGLQFYCRACSADIYRQRREAKGYRVRERVVVPPGHKHCRDCGLSKPHAEWHTNRASRDGFAAYCIACTTIRGRESYFRRKYGLSQKELEQLRDVVIVCPICLKRPPVHVDHDHETGAVRGMLCFPCNAALGQLQDDPTIIRRAAEYVEGNVWQPIKVAAGVYPPPISLPEARPSLSSSGYMPPIFSPGGVRRLRPR